MLLGIGAKEFKNKNIYWSGACQGGGANCYCFEYKNVRFKPISSFSFPFLLDSDTKIHSILFLNIYINFFIFIEHIQKSFYYYFKPYEQVTRLLKGEIFKTCFFLGGILFKFYMPIITPPPEKNLSCAPSISLKETI